MYIVLTEMRSNNVIINHRVKNYQNLKNVHNLSVLSFQIKFFIYSDYIIISRLKCIYVYPVYNMYNNDTETKYFLLNWLIIFNLWLLSQLSSHYGMYALCTILVISTIILIISKSNKNKCKCLRNVCNDIIINILHFILKIINKFI